MKKIKKITGLLLAVVIAMSMMMTAFADENPGSITIVKAIKDQTYTVYRLFDLQEYNPDRNAYIYTVNENWTGFINQDSIKGTYIDITNDGNVIWIEGADVATFAKLAITYANDHGISAVKEVTAETDPVVVSDLPLGYYLIDSSVGTLCSLDTTNPEVTVEEKNDHPTVDKKVLQNSSQSYESTNDTDIGQTVNFRAHIHTKPGAEKYVFHDYMSEGLTLDPSSIKVYYVDGVSTTEHEVADTKYTYRDTETCGEDCTFEIAFDDSFVHTLGMDDMIIVIYYNATLNENAIVWDSENPNGNTNTVKLKYGENSWTEESTTETFTYEFDLVKTDSANVLLGGAEFKLYNTRDDIDKNLNAFKFVVAGNVYRVATDDEIKDSTITTVDVIKVTDGIVTISGLDGHYKYWLVETKAPNGYNRLNGPVSYELIPESSKATITDGKITTTDNKKIDVKLYSTENNGGYQVINNAGGELPSTGGVGTTMFYVGGGILVLLAVVLLITKKRMGDTEN